MKVKYILFYLFLFIFTISVFPDEINDDIRVSGKYYFKFVRKSNNSDLRKSEFIIKNLEEKYPDNYMLKAFLGRIYFQKASSSFWIWNKYKWAYRGINLQDEAVKNNPENIFIIYTRAIGCLRLPDFFGRLKTAEKDFKKIIAIIEEKKITYKTDYWEDFQNFHRDFTFNYEIESEKLEKDFRQRCYYMLAVLYNRVNERKKMYKYVNKTIKLDQNSNWAMYARMLYKYEDKKIYLKK